VTQSDSPFSPASRRHKSGGRYDGRGSLSSGVVLTTLGTIHQDPLGVDVERDVVDGTEERIELEILSTAIGGEDGEPVSDSDSHSARTPAPAYHSVEQFPQRRFTSYEDEVNRGLRISVEQATTRD
jgi:hypothetical protein